MANKQQSSIEALKAQLDQSQRDVVLLQQALQVATKLKQEHKI